MLMIPGLFQLLLILTILHGSYGGGTSVRGKVIYQGYWQLVHRGRKGPFNTFSKNIFSKRVSID